MALELKSIIDYFGIEADPENLTEEQFQEEIKKKVVFREVAHLDADHVNKMTGRTLGAIETEFKQRAKDLGIEFEDGELKDKKLTEVINITFDKANKKIASLTEATKADKGTKHKELEEELNKYKTEIGTYKEVAQKANQTLAEKEQEWNSQLKRFKLDTHLKEIKSKIPFSSDASPYTIKGFEASINEEVEFDFDENESIIIKSKKTGLPLTTETGNKIESVENFFTKKAKEAGILKVNNTPGGKPAGSFSYTAPTGGNGNAGAGENTVQPNKKALEHAERLAQQG